MEPIELSLICAGIIFLSFGAYNVFRIIHRINYYKPQWYTYFSLILVFIGFYVSTIFLSYLQEELIHAMLAVLLLLGGIFVYLSSSLSSKTIIHIADLEKVHREYENLRYHAEHDLLTGCNSRNYFLKIIEARFDALKIERKKIALLFIDLDGFKQVNDKLGHSVGDHTLQAVGTFLLQRFRKNDVVVRFGGDEFVIMMEEADVKTASKVAQDVATSLNQYIKAQVSPKIDIGCSIGIAEMSYRSPSYKYVLEQADKFCYQAKNHPTISVFYAGMIITEPKRRAYA